MTDTAAGEEFSALVARIRADPAVAGAVLSGSRARRGMATHRSDYDVYVITGGDGTVAEERRDSRLDVVVMPLKEFRTHAMPESGSEWNRYAFAHAHVLKDRPDGLIGELVARKATLSAEEAGQTAAHAVDGFANAVYRWLKNHRDGRAVEARLDAAESIPPLLTCLFALEGRVRPYNKYLAWELRTHPLGAPAWRHERLLPLLEAVLSDADPRTARRLFLDLEPLARAAGHGPVLDAWGDDLNVLRHGPN
ncbi:hypothetical protein [Microbispora sp. ATCC PTA-5024]|uniref:hypothetical protein n=1 Tax=Microbispora sp. ATCC PTA-5024 TaxID=316330 RepID=UPI0003DB8934|nr:hypothetical protein [Microbispora sp. ATCC PTA-5024]ETK30953.1 hypothetical protein MPTA5024_37470 [Microbispora sp. ATCC PTA-5024]